MMNLCVKFGCFAPDDVVGIQINKKKAVFMYYSY